MGEKLTKQSLRLCQRPGNKTLIFRRFLRVDSGVASLVGSGVEGGIFILEQQHKKSCIRSVWTGALPGAAEMRIRGGAAQRGKII